MLKLTNCLKILNADDIPVKYITNNNEKKCLLRRKHKKIHLKFFSNANTIETTTKNYNEIEEKGRERMEERRAIQSV